MVVLRQKDQMPTRNADLGRKPGALGANGVLDDLHHQSLTFKNLLFDGHQRLRTASDLRRLSLRLALPHIGHMQKRSALKSNVNEGRLHTRQDASNLAQIHVANQAAFKCALNMQFLNSALLDHSNSGFLG